MPSEPAESEWTQDELRIAILQVLLAARIKKPSAGGASGKMLMDALQRTSIVELELALWYLRGNSYIETGERVFMITVAGVDYLGHQLERFQKSAPMTYENGRLFKFLREFLTQSELYSKPISRTHQPDQKDLQKGFADLHIPILQVLFDDYKNDPNTGGVSGKILIDFLQLESLEELDWELWYLKDGGFLEMDNGEFMITEAGIDYLNQQRAKPVTWVDGD
jgi:hypothetical protein